MNTYRLLKDLPGIPAGTESASSSGVGFICFKYGADVHYYFTESDVIKYPDFFEKVQNGPKIFSMSDMEHVFKDLFELLTNGSPNSEPHSPWRCTFKACIRNRFPNIKLD